MTQIFSLVHGDMHLHLEKEQSGWTFSNGEITVRDIQEDLFAAHCERLKKSLSKDMPVAWESWQEQPFSKKVFSLVTHWRWNGVYFLEDCASFPFSEDRIPEPELLPDGTIDMAPVLDYLAQWGSTAEKRHYPLSRESHMDYCRKFKILARYWGFRDTDHYYTEKSLEFLTERLEKPLGAKEHYPSCWFRIGQAPNERWGIIYQTQQNIYHGMWCRYQFTSRDSAILHEIPVLKNKIAQDKEVRNRKEVLEWLESLESCLVQPELFAFAG